MVGGRGVHPHPEGFYNLAHYHGHVVADVLLVVVVGGGGGGEET